MKNKKLLISFLIVITLLIVPTMVNAQDDIVIMLDPGHGGTESGAAAGGLVEKDLTWKLATRVKQILDNTPGITGILTKQESETLDRETRAIRAKENDADLLVSFHINSNEASSSLSGAEVYITHNTTQRRYYEYSNILGTDILTNLRSVGVPSFSYKPKIRVGADWDVYEDGTIADYYGIISWPMHYGIPSVLIEHCFINNPYDRLNFLNDTMLTRMAEADANAIIKNKELFRRTYYGKISTKLNSMEFITGGNGDRYIKGTIDVAEVVNGNAGTPKDLPLLSLKSTDGTVNRKLFSYLMGGTTYYYDTDIDTLDPNKEYYIEAYLTSSENIETTQNKTQKITFPDKTLGTGKNGVLNAKNNQLYFQYEGETVVTLNTMDVIKSNQKPYVKGTAKIEENINGTKYSFNNNSQVTFTLESTDGTFTKKMYSYWQGNSTFYFDTNIECLDKEKTYHIIAKVDNPNNIALDTKKAKEISLQGKTIIGPYNDLHIVVEGNTFRVTEEYQASIQTTIQNLSMNDNGAGRHYISGDIKIMENVDGKSMVPTTLPGLTLKTADGFEQKMYIHDSGNGSYYFDTYIEDLNKDKKYYIEAKLTNPNNIAQDTEKTQKVVISNRQLGRMGDYKVTIENSEIGFMDATLYVGTISTQIQNLSMNDNGAGRHYISGNIKIMENVDGKATISTTLPSLTLKTADGFEQKMYIHDSGNGSYYFDTYIEDIDKDKKYYIEAELTNPKNLASAEQKIQQVSLSDKLLGKIADKKVQIQDGYLEFIDADKYQGTINTSLSNFSLNNNGAGRHYISGNIVIKEKVNGVLTVPSTLPTLTLKTADGFSQNMYVHHSENGNYYFDTYIEELDTTKKYYIEASLTNPNNIANVNEKVQTITIPAKELGKVKGLKVVIQNNYLQFMEADKYEASINTNLQSISLNQNGTGGNYICGYLQISEVMNGKANVPAPLPELTLNSVDGQFSKKMYLHHSGNGNYYFDTYIDELDTTKQYFIQAKLTNVNNIASANQKTKKLSIKNQTLGQMNQYTVSIANGNIYFN